MTRREPGGLIVVSHIAVEPPRRQLLEDAFRDRAGEVDAWPGFRQLEVWQDTRLEDRYVMVSWWDDEESFRSYLRSDAHRRSHARVPDGARPAGMERFRFVAR